jgi:hypothetical protein
MMRVGASLGAYTVQTLLNTPSAQKHGVHIVDSLENIAGNMSLLASIEQRDPGVNC